MKRVSLYFDFISPYVDLALHDVPEIEAAAGGPIECVPVVFGAILKETGLVGPVEVEAKRRYTFQDVLRRALSLGRSMVGPPSHPFVTLAALRTVCAFQGDERAPALVERLSRACWGEGRDLTDPAVIEAAVADVGLPTEQLKDRIKNPEMKNRLRANTARALEQGAFGIPTFELENELFWGHDRVPDLLDRLRGVAPPDAAHVASMVARPRGVDRRARS